VLYRCHRLFNPPSNLESTKKHHIVIMSLRGWSIVCQALNSPCRCSMHGHACPYSDSCFAESSFTATLIAASAALSTGVPFLRRDVSLQLRVHSLFFITLALLVRGRHCSPCHDNCHSSDRSTFVSRGPSPLALHHRRDTSWRRETSARQNALQPQRIGPCTQFVA
jgi:hypothetical protein